MIDDTGVILITGAGSGLGRALAVELCKRGRIVVGLGRNSETLQQTGSLTGSGNFTYHAVDVSDGSAVRAVVEKITNDSGFISVLLNNAAVYPRQDVTEQTSDQFMDTIHINLGGSVHCTYAVLDGMIASGAGRIINVASFADLAPLPASSAYSVSKGAGRVFTRSLVADLGDRFPNIIVNDWLPGMLKTQMGIEDGLDPSVAAIWGANLALSNDPALNGIMFEQNQEVLPPNGVKQKIKRLITFQKRRQPRTLG